MCCGALEWQKWGFCNRRHPSPGLIQDEPHRQNVHCNVEKGWYFLCAGKQYVSFHSGNNSKPPLWFPDPQALQAERSLCISASKVWIRQRISDSIRLSIRVQRQSRKCVNLKRSCWITARTTWKSAAVSLRSNAWRGTDNQKNDGRTYMNLWGPRSPASWV